MKRNHAMTRVRKALAASILVALGAYAGGAAAQQSFSSLTCRAGTVSGLAKGQDMVVFSLEHRGVSLAQEEPKTFDNYTQRCMGTVAIVRGIAKGSGFCRNVDPANGDITVVEWTTGEKMGAGTFRFIYGTGKWKGITGGGEYQSTGATRPVDDGTYQNCVRTKGTFSVPKH